MPARPRIPNPQDGDLQAFAFDLRELGVGKVGVSWIATHWETSPSRAALYAALSGKRLPEPDTVSTLLRWWAGSPDAERAQDSLRGDPIWGWIERLPAEHEARDQAQEWKARYLALARREGRRRWQPRPDALPVQIDVPREQHLFIAQLEALLAKTGLEDSLWLIFGTDTLRIDRYLQGQVIPNDTWCSRIVWTLVMFIDGLDVETESDRLRRAAALARAARVRDRRIARKTSPARLTPRSAAAPKRGAR
ncbi:hypothetical protein [Streptomyces sp. NPDC052114]|uniref:hypothetical protein n=1 Tax=unclassified Streptomyces TaxID=2593676 RepID=UPI0034400D3D